jgi:hypothetical protein
LREDAEQANIAEVCTGRRIRRRGSSRAEQVRFRGAAREIGFRRRRGDDYRLRSEPDPTPVRERQREERQRGEQCDCRGDAPAPRRRRHSGGHV